MKTVINSSLLFEKIYSILESAFSRNISNLEITLNYDDNDLSVEIEGITSDLFKSEEYRKLVSVSRIYLFDYFFGLSYLDRETSVEVDSLKVDNYYSLDISYIDEDLINSVFISSRYDLNDYSIICAYEFSGDNSYQLVYLSDNYEDVQEEEVSSGDVIYNYIELCMGRNEIVSFTEWVDEQYSSDIVALSRELRNYKKSNYFDSSYAKENLRDNDLFFPNYSYFEENGHDNYSILVDYLYKNNKISEQIKKALFDIDEETYESITYQILRKCEIDLKSEGIPDADKYFTFTEYSHYDSIFIEKSEIQGWGDEYQCYDWLTQDKLEELIEDSGSDLDAYEIWQIFIGSVKYDYEQEIEFFCYVYISYDDVLKIINDADLKYGVKSLDNTVWEEEE